MHGDRRQEQNLPDAKPTRMKWPPLPKGFGLRLAKGQDLPVLRGLMAEYFAELGLTLETQGLDADLADPQEGYQGGGMILLTQGGLEVGCVGLRTLEPGVGEIKRMYLRPGCRGAGLGRLLMESVLALARAGGLKRLVLDTRLDLAAANTLYENHGFVDTRDYNQNPRAERFMTLDLD